MTKRKDLPEEATEEPKIRSTEEDAERAARRQEEGDRLTTAEDGRWLADPHNPLRMPGEMSSRPDEDPAEDRPERASDDESDE